MNFFINNLAVLLTIVAIVSIIVFFFLVYTKPTYLDTNYTSVTTGRFSCKSPNTSNTPKPMTTYRDGFLR